jgi:hypothetical protein
MNKYSINYHQIGGSNKFNPGDRFRNTMNGKTGIIRRLRSDSHEQNTSWRMNPPQYHYHVDYDNGSFETYESEMFMQQISISSHTYNQHSFTNMRNDGRKYNFDSWDDYFIKIISQFCKNKRFSKLSNINNLN